MLLDEELQQVDACLRQALVVNDAGAKIPSRFDKIRHPFAARAWAAARRQAARDLIAAGDLLDAAPPPASGSAAIVPVPAAGERNALVLLARHELQRAVAAERFTPWTLRCSAALALNAETCWRRLGSDGQR
ncbi:MAG TPA: hypothetical protein VFS37_05205, partial [Conexibacter sp.]|nr:hypothetical protein [Conexibacter sp.]